MDIPNNWTFCDKSIAEGFDEHVQEQLPWYKLVTEAVSHIARHYIPQGGVVYDIGASTGNMGRALHTCLLARHATLYAVEPSSEMVEQYKKSGATGHVYQCNAEDAPYDKHDLSICFLSVMFMPVSTRAAFLRRLFSLCNDGGAMVIVDKVETPSGYPGTVLRRLTMDWKIRNGASPADILKKELSLAGYQRPIDPLTVLPDGAQQFFQLGEFCGWVIEKRSK